MPTRLCSSRRPVAISTVCVSSSNRNDPISAACMCMIGGNGGLCPAWIAAIFPIASGMNPIRTRTMNHAAMNTKIQRSIACARGVPERASCPLLGWKNRPATVAMAFPLAV